MLDRLRHWSARASANKPLILRGARQVGKTTLVKLLASSYKQDIYLNLDIEKEKVLFEIHREVHDLFQAICLQKGVNPQKGRTLLFIDEIQNSSNAVSMLRYFYEQLPWLDVIAAGSLLESVMDRKISFPVGRVEYLPVRPCTFQEFLLAAGEARSLELLQEVPVQEFAHGHLMEQFKRYTLTGGMPEVVALYHKEMELTALAPVYEGMLASYLDDVEKYARNDTLAEVMRHTVRHAFQAAGSRITYSGFGGSVYKNREVQEAFSTLEKAYLFQLVFPVTETRIPALPNTGRSPKLQLLDTGLVNYMAGLQTEVFNAASISDAYRGRIAEHITGQELLSLSDSVLFKLNYWTREKMTSSAEVDFVWPYRDYLIPIEVKSGTIGKLRSLHQFIDQAPHSYAVRVYSGHYGITRAKTLSGKEFSLMNLPFYLIHRLPDYLEHLIR
ncbi:MAG: AAA family ATPase [Bacteroidota bacterium]